MAKKVIIVFLTVILSLTVLSGCVSFRRTGADSTADTTEKETAKDTAEADTTREVTTAEETTAAETAVPSVPPAYVEPTAATGGMYPTILTYHLILDEPFTQFTNLFVRVSDFEAQLQKLSNAGYSFLFADEFGEVGTKSVILTFDDGYADNYTNMFPLLKKYNAKATVFMISNAIDTDGYLTGDQISEMAASGLVHFGSHTVSHRNLQNLSEEEQRRQLAESKATLQALTGQEINSLCYPAGKYNSTTIALASEYYSFGYTTNRGKYNGEDAFELPRIAVQRGMSADGLLWTLGD